MEHAVRSRLGGRKWCSIKRKLGIRGRIEGTVEWLRTVMFRISFNNISRLALKGRQTGLLRTKELEYSQTVDWKRAL